MLEYPLLFAAGWATHAIVADELADDGSDDVESFLDERESQLRERYESTQMDYVEFGERVALLERPGTERIMREAVVVDGVGEEIAFEIARSFDGDYEAFQAAGREKLEEVNGVGENRATALLSR